MRNLVIEPKEIIFPPTYVFSSSKISFIIRNEGEKIVDFEWKCHLTSEDEAKALENYIENHPEDRNNSTNISKYHSEDFSFELLNGSIWPNGVQTQILNFHPKNVGLIRGQAFLTNNISNIRSQIRFSGKSLPPEAQFNVSSINVGHISLDSYVEYQIYLKNIGNCPVQFEYDPSSCSDNSIIVQQKSGVIEKANQHPINIIYQATTIGQFNYDLKFLIKLNSEISPSFSLFGRVFGPSFSVSPTFLAFGDVSLGFLSEKELEISNTSNIPFEYQINLKQDGSFHSREFGIFPESGVVSENSSSIVKVQLIPEMIKDYMVNLSINSKQNGHKLMTIPISAHSSVPLIYLQSKEYNIGENFIGYPHVISIVLVNDSKFSAKFEMSSINDSNTIGMHLAVSVSRGIILPYSTFCFELTITPNQLGNFSINRFVSVHGCENPLEFRIAGICIGPNVSISKKLLDYGEIEVLINHTQSFSITNNSNIDSKFIIEFSDDDTPFSLDKMSGIIKAGNTDTLCVTACLNDNVLFSSNIMVCIEYLSPIIISIKAKGKGHCILSSIDISQVVFGSNLIGNIIRKSFSLQNKGRKSKDIRWIINRSKKDSHSSYTFHVEPDHSILPPNSSTEFTFCIESNEPCTYEIESSCSLTLNRQRIDIFSSKVIGSFDSANLSFRKKSLNFQYIHNINEEERLSKEKDISCFAQPIKDMLIPSSTENIITNISSMPVLISVNYYEPFYVSPSNFSLLPNESSSFSVIFDPSFKKDFLSEVLHRKIEFKVMNFPKPFFIDVIAEYCFPNIKILENNDIDFGIVPVNIEKSKSITLSNPGLLDIEYSWEIIPDLIGSCVFDIFPLRGFIPSNHIEKCHITFFSNGINGSNNSLRSARAVCHIKGGPDYCLHLGGTSAQTCFEIDPRKFELGFIRSTELNKLSFSISNNGSYDIEYQITLPKSTQLVDLCVLPIHGKIMPSCIQTFQVTFLAIIPNRFIEYLSIELDHFIEERIAFTAEVYHPCLIINLPKDKREIFIKSMNCDNASTHNEEILNALEIKQARHRAKELLKRNQSITKLPALIQAFPESDSRIIISTHVFDIGKLILGPKLSFCFSFFVETHHPFNLRLDIDHLNGSGFCFQNDKIDCIDNQEIFVYFSFDPTLRVHSIFGQQEYMINLMVSNDLCYSVRILCDIQFIEPLISTETIIFEETIVGHKRYSYFQLRNHYDLTMDISFMPIENFINPRKSMRFNSQNPFYTDSNVIVLEPNTCQTIMMEFSPIESGIFEFRLPIRVTHSPNLRYVVLKGKAIFLNIILEPSTIFFPVSQPFCDPIIQPFCIKNPSKYPIEVYSMQFDQFLLSNPQNNNIPNVHEQINELPCLSLGFCIIIHGPRISGKSSLAKKLSTIYQLPIITLLDIWDDLVSKNDLNENNYISAFSNYIKKGIYQLGFIIDGIDVFPENNDTDQAVYQFMKAKPHVFTEERLSEMINVFPHNHQTSYEKALSYIFPSLSDYALLLICLNKIETEPSPLISFSNNINSIEDQGKKSEIEELFRMTDEEYSRLSYEEQRNVDQKRELHRQQLINHDKSETISSEQKSRISTSASTSSKAKLLSKKTKAKISLPVDPLVISLMNFHLSLGSILQNMKKFEFPNSKIVYRNIKESLEDSEGSYFNDFFLLLGGRTTLENRVSSVIRIFPQLASIRDQYYTSLIPESSLIIPNHIKNGILSNSIIKDCFYISKESEKVHYPTLTPRWIVGPEETIKMNVFFQPSQPGKVTSDLLFSISNCKSEPAALKLHGSCSFPDIDRNFKSIFPKVVSSLSSKADYVFIEKTKEFHFGSLIISKDKSGKTGPVVYQQSIHITNISSFPTEIICQISNTAHKNVWLIDNNHFVLSPHESIDVTIGFNPSVPDHYRALMGIFIKDHPEPLSFIIDAVGCVPSLDVSSNSIDFDKILCNQSKTMKLDFKNPSLIPSFWRVKGGNTLGNCFLMNHIEGLMNPHSSNSFELTFKSLKSICIKKSINIDIMDKSKSKVFSSIPISIIAEAFESSFDIVYPKGDSLLNFHEIKVNKQSTLPILIKNKGKYPISFKIFFGKSPLKQYISFDNMEGQIPSCEKSFCINATFNSENSILVDNDKSITIKIEDLSTNTELAVLPIPITAHVLFSSFSLSPSECLDLGEIQTNTQINSRFLLKNTGSFPFDFEFIFKNEEKNEISLPIVPKENKKKGTPRTNNVNKSKSRAKSTNSLSVDDFIITPFSGCITPGHSMAFDVEFFSQRPALHSSVFIIKISDLPPHFDQGIPFLLKAKPNHPSIVTDDYERLFSRYQLCVRADLKANNTSSFLLDEKVFHFAPTMLHSAISCDFNIINDNPINCSIDVSLNSFIGPPQVLPAFTIGCSCFDLQPNSTGILNIRFNPTSLGIYKCLILITVKGGEKFSISVEGEGSLPSLILTHQGEISPISSMLFGRALIGTTKEKTVSIYNNSYVNATFCINASTTPDFFIRDSDLNGTFSLEPKKTKEICISFAPSKAKRCQYEITFNIDGNSAASPTLYCVGEGFAEEIVFDGVNNEDSDIYFKDTIVGLPQKAIFHMKNISPNDIRFSWAPQTDFSFYPKIGHIKPNGSKVITVTFFAERPVKHNPLKALCQWSKITLEDPEQSDWDESKTEGIHKSKSKISSPISISEPKQTSRRFPPHRPSIKDNKKLIEKSINDNEPDEEGKIVINNSDSIGEPAFSIINSKSKDLQLRIFATSDLIKYTLDTSSISFAPTMMYETRVYTVVLANTSHIKFSYSWYLQNLLFHRGTNNNASQPFSIEPSKGSISPGQSQSFIVKFSPKDVDEYSAVYRCDIPYLFNLNPPIINLVGFSKRPLCHFNIEISDYLSSGRRLPEFGGILPPNVRVIEVIANKMNTQSIKCIELINTTNLAYEITWTNISDYSTSTIDCDIRFALVSSSKVFPIRFYYTPNSMKTVESLWLFEIPQYDLKVHFLIVGRFVPSK